MSVFREKFGFGDEAPAALNNLKELAKEIVAGEKLIYVPLRTSTIHSGLRLNHPRNVALIHPVIFILRRILFVAAIFFFD